MVFDNEELESYMKEQEKAEKYWQDVKTNMNLITQFQRDIIKETERLQNLKAKAAKAAASLTPEAKEEREKLAASFATIENTSQQLAQEMAGLQENEKKLLADLEGVQKQKQVVEQKLASVGKV